MGLSIGDFSRIKYVGSGSDKGTYDAEFQAASEATGVPVALLKAIADAESDFRNLKPNRCGAAGIMQLIPSTAASLGVSDVQDPAQNIMGGAKYIAQQLEAFDGDVDKALGAYNAGPNNVKNGKYLKFEETRNYIEKINGYLAEGVPEAGKLHGTERKTLPSRNRERKAANVATLLSTARAEVGTTEWPADSNQVKYNDWYYGSNVKGDDYPWCMAFVQWCYKTAGIDLPCKTASCSGLLDWYRKNSPECVVQDPQPGDIAIKNFAGGAVREPEQRWRRVREAQGEGQRGGLYPSRGPGERQPGPGKGFVHLGAGHGQPEVLRHGVRQGRVPGVQAAGRRAVQRREAGRYYRQSGLGPHGRRPGWHRSEPGGRGCGEEDGGGCREQGRRGAGA